MADRIGAHVSRRSIVVLGLLVLLGGAFYAGGSVLAKGSASSAPIYSSTGGARQVVVTEPSGSSSTNELLGLGQAHLTASCANTGTQTTGRIDVTAAAGQPVLVTDANPTPAKLEPSPPQTIVSLTAGHFNGIHVAKENFSIVGANSGTGTATIRVNPGQGRCFLTAYAFG